MESAKTVEQKNSELTSSHRNTNITVIYTASIFKNWNLPEKDLQSKIERRTHSKTGRRGRVTAQANPMPTGNPQTGESLHCRGSLQGERGLSPTSGSPVGVPES